jgi:hypothetical protein
MSTGTTEEKSEEGPGAVQCGIHNHYYYPPLSLLFCPQSLLSLIRKGKEKDICSIQSSLSLSSISIAQHNTQQSVNLPFSISLVCY